MARRSWNEKCTEDEFIRLYKEMNPTELARHLGTTTPKIYERRKAIELRKEITIGRNTNEAFNGICEIEIKNGCVLVGNDAHYWPGTAPTMHRAMLWLCKKLTPTVVVANGDMFDGASVSRFSSIGWEKSPTVQQELEVVQDRMDELLKASRNAAHYWTAGNHDLRFESRLAAVAPEYRGVKGIHLKDHIQGWQPCWALDVNRNTPSWTEIRHREKGGIHASYRNTVEAGVTVVTGHDHRADVVPYNDRRGRRYGVRTGMMAESSLNSQFRDYMEAKRNNWQAACAVLTYQDGRLLYPELCLQVEPGLIEWRGQYVSV